MTSSSDHAPGAPGQDADGLITTADQLRAYLDAHPAHHAPAGDGQCTCGWPHVVPELRAAVAAGSSFPTPEQHAAAVLIGDLGDLLPSDTSAQGDRGMTPVPWRALVRTLYQQIDERDSSIDPRFLALMQWCVAQGHADADAVARVTGLHPDYLARLLSGSADSRPPAAAR